ncbi:MAG: 16S rRNA (cytosine(1402)-N(4))-methyltransferase RsmH [Chlamydiia bacterium]|nr:16S rRNA (cytosine(1402)-N(4))-methyltransferase RsmH [Chlamydiia bacterium]
MHKSVLWKEVLESFQDIDLKVFVDGTLGAGGHSGLILKAHPKIEKLVGFDQDPQALALAKQNLKPFESKIEFIADNFSNLSKHVSSADGILVDLGVSSMQLDQAEKGFSFRFEGPLDMRMNPEGELSAEEIVNQWDEKELALIFRDFGEEKKWRKAARIVVEARKSAPITTTKQLVDILEKPLFDPKSKIHPLTRVFQALRIATNRELDVLKAFLPQALQVLNPGGRLAVISFHSLEDRIVKRFFRDKASDKVSTEGLGGVFLDKEPEGKVLTSKPIEAKDEEIQENPRARSAKLRVFEKSA